MIPTQLIGMILVASAVKFWLLIRSGQGKLPAWARWRIVLFALFLYVMPVGALQFTQFKLSVTGNMGRVVYAYGYTLPWIFDYLGSRNLGSIAEQAKLYSENFHDDRLTSVIPPLNIKSNILVMQLETIGAGILDFEYLGEQVMPFMHELKSKSMCFRIVSFHSNGSCDMDYAVTTLSRPYPSVVPYRLPGIKYANSIPQFMKQHGFRTYVFHGNTQLFYDRGPVMERLGFDHIFFKEQLARRHLKSSIMGVRDAELFRCVLDAVGSEKRAYIFVITLDTHAPYNLLDESEMEIFPQPKTLVEKYLNSARYLDNCLRELVGKLPNDTALIFYGDHTASMISSMFTSDVSDGVEYVPCLIYQKGNDLSQFQQTQYQGDFTNGTLNVLDVMGYLRNSVLVSDENRKKVSAPVLKHFQPN